MKPSRSHGAVSPVVGVILLVAVTVILSATVGVFVLDLGNNVDDGSIDAANTEFTDDADGGNQVTLTNVAGSVQTDSLQVKVSADDGRSATLDAAGSIDGDLPVGGIEGPLAAGEWQAGDRLTFAVTDPSVDEVQVSVVDTESSTVLSSGEVDLRSYEVAGTYDSCLDILNAGESQGDGVYEIEPSGNPIGVYCDMTTDGGGWTEISLASAKHTFDSDLSVFEDTSPYDYGFDGNRPYSVNPGTHGARYDISLGFSYSEFYAEDFQMRSTSYIGEDPDDTSEIRTCYEMTDWSQAWDNDTNGCGYVGEFGFGSPDATGPAASYSAALGSSIGSHDAVYTYPENGVIYNTGVSSTTFRIQWGETGGQYEGWMWYGGSVYVR